MSNRTSSKSQLFLMEFICVIMFFAICAAICISVFVKADNISKDSHKLNEALLLAQSMAETIKVMDCPSHDNIRLEAEKLNMYSTDKYSVKVKDKMLEDILQAEIYVYDIKDSKKEICSISMKKYIPSEVQNAE